MAHPQLLSQLLGRSLPPAPVEESQPDVPSVPPAVQATARQQTASNWAYRFRHPELERISHGA